VRRHTQEAIIEFIGVGGDHLGRVVAGDHARSIVSEVDAQHRRRQGLKAARLVACRGDADRVQLRAETVCQNACRRHGAQGEFRPVQRHQHRLHAHVDRRGVLRGGH
jgi:hypothetical protein